MNVARSIFALILIHIFVFPVKAGIAAEKFVIMTAGLSIRHTPLYYGQENGFFRDEGLELQSLVVRAGQVGIASLMSGEVDAITNAGTGLAAALPKWTTSPTPLRTGTRRRMGWRRS